MNLEDRVVVVTGAAGGIGAALAGRFGGGGAGGGVGAAVTAVLFVAGKYFIGLYLGQTNPGKAFGAAGSLAVMLLWIYYSSLILLFGAEFTQAWMEHRGHRIVPEQGAVRVQDQRQYLQT
jgi:uncharacterized BrkB/YihY/UPF0761 family membrane protein